MRFNSISLYALIVAAFLVYTTSCSLSPSNDSESVLRRTNTIPNGENKVGTSTLIKSLAEEELGRSSILAEEIPLTSQTNYYFLRGDVAYNNHNFDEAFSFYKLAAENELRPAPLLRERLVELYVRSGDLSTALTELDKMMEGDQITADILELRGLIQIGLESYEDALETYNTIRQKFNVKSEDISILTGSLLLALDRPSDAITTLSAWVRDNPNSFLGFYYLGKAFLMVDNLKDAEASFQSAVTLRPVPAPILIDYSRLLLSLGKTNEAKTIITKLLESNIDDDDVKLLARTLADAENGKVLDLSPSSSSYPIPLDAIVHTAMLRFESRDFFGAQASLLVAIAADPDNARAHYYLGSTFLAIQEMEDAIGELLKIKAGQMFFEDSRTLAAYLLQSRKEYSRAIASMKELTEARPGNPRLLNLLATVYRESGDLEHAASTMETLSKLVPNDDKIFFTMGVVYDDLGRKNEAIDLMRKALTINPINANALNYLAYTYAEQGTNLEEALALVQKALSIEAENGYYVDTLGWIYYRMGKNADALREMQRAVELTPNDAVILEHLALVQIAMGQTANAIVTLQKALDNTTESDDKGVNHRVRALLDSLR